MDSLHAKNPLYPFLSLASSVIFLVVGLIYAKNPLFPVYILEVCLVYCVFGFWRTVLKCVVIFIPVSFVFGLFSFLFQQDIETAMQMSGRIVLLGVSAVPVITLPPINLTRSLESIGCPRILTLGMLVAIRFVPVVLDEVRRVREATRTRGARGSFYRAFIIPITIRLVNISDIMALSLETRAFSTGSEPVSVYHKITFGQRDLLYSVVSIVLVAVWMVIA